MSGALDFLNVGVSAAAIAACAYVLYNALIMRKTLAVGPYRRHALGMGFVAGLFALDQASNFFPTSGAWNYLGLAVFAAFALGLLYWVDSSILTARRSDPLDRDTFHWSFLRRIIWVGAVGAFCFVSLVSLVLPPPGVGSQAPPPEWLNDTFTVVFFFPVYTAAISAVLVIPVAARRCKDLVFRRHLEWFFLFVAIQLVLAGGVGQLFQNPGGSSTAISSFLDGVGILVGFYPLYMSVRRLVPLYRFDNDARVGVGPMTASTPRMAQP
jgi:hypothetical protein